MWDIYVKEMHLELFPCDTCTNTFTCWRLVCSYLASLRSILLWYTLCLMLESKEKTRPRVLRWIAEGAKTWVGVTDHGGFRSMKLICAFFHICYWLNMIGSQRVILKISSTKKHNTLTLIIGIFHTELSVIPGYKDPT